MKRKCTIVFFIIIVIFCQFLNEMPSIAQSDESFKMTPISEEAYYTMTQFFQYDKEIPLSAKIILQEDLSDCTREKIVFNSFKGDRVPGYLAFPKKGQAPYPCILMLHGLDGMGKSSWWKGDSIIDIPVKEAILSSGYAILALDAQYEGERKANNDYTSATEFLKNGWYHKLREMIVQSTVDYRRALDYLETRSDIDMSRIGVFGYSLGGMMTFLLTGTDSRVKVSVAAVSPLAGRNSPSNMASFSKYQLSAVSPKNYTKAINDRPFLMLMSKMDSYYTIDEAQQVYDLINSKTKDLIFFESGHYLPIEYVDYVIKWFVDYL
jgi:dienelactone hydrolase